MTLFGVIAFRVYGDPKGEPRAKAYRRGDKAGIYQPKVADGWREAIGLEAKQHRPPEPIQGPVRVDLIIIVRRPGGHEATGRNAGKLKKSAPVFYHTAGHGPYGGDRDNFEKAILDVLTQVGFWGDDGQVADGLIRKRWARVNEPPGAVIRIQPLDDRDPLDSWSRLDEMFSTGQVALPAPPKPKPSGPRGTAPYRQFTDAFTAAWQARHGRKYIWGGAKDGNAATMIWEGLEANLEDAKKVIAAYMADEDRFYEGHSVAMLNMHLQRFVARIGQRPSTYRSAAELGKAAMELTRKKP